MRRRGYSPLRNPAIISSFINFVSKVGPGRGRPLFSSGCEEAAFLLEGGGLTLLEGLRHSDIPCTGRLSVPGFLAFLCLFLARRRFILVGEEAHS